MGAIVGWLIAALCLALFVVFVVASVSIALLGILHPPEGETQ